MTLSEKKLEMIQALLLLQDKVALFEIEKLIVVAFKADKSSHVRSSNAEKTPATFEAWSAQFEDTKQSGGEDGMTLTEFRQRIWAAEKSEEMTLEEFFARIAQN